jgi:hypothetical protein
MYVTARFTDGLGNRLFQLAAMLDYARKHGHTPVFVKEFIWLQAHAQSAARIQDYFPELQTISSESVGEWKEIVEPPDGGFTYYEMPFIDGNVCLQGYFQAHQYTTGLLSFLTATGKPPRLLTDATLPPHPYKSCAFLHVRRGDYLLEVCRHHYVPLENYWRYALAGLMDAGTHILVCSNDLEWCRRELPEKYGDLVPADRWIFFEGDEVQTLTAMMRCGRGGATANSTYSWWGALLNKTEFPYVEKTYMPAVWGFPPLPPVRDLYPPWATVLPT